ncbi:MAG: radical SAM family heme chaperone HemW [Bacteroidota bacterium]
MLYIHIPFCKSYCTYCSFFRTTSLDLKEKYVDNLCREIALRHDYLGKTSLDTIYFGGGTPSLLTADELSKIFSAIGKYFTITDEAEITLECNPDDIDARFVADLKCFPINRISIGIQSFDDEQLRRLNRRHNRRQAVDCVCRLQDNGFDNISVDIIYSLPNQTLTSLNADIDQLLRLGVQHISAYSLTYERGTKLFDMRQRGKVEAISDEDSKQLFDTLCYRLQNNGFEHYEISNFALPHRHAVHNSGYWAGAKYLGIGAAAHSFDGSSRQWNPSDIDKYCLQIDRRQTFDERETLTSADRYNEFIFLSLRTAEGIDTDRLALLFGSDARDYCMANAHKYIDEKLLKITGSRLSLTHDGIFVSDGIMSSLMR